MRSQSRLYRALTDLQTRGRISRRYSLGGKASRRSISRWQLPNSSLSTFRPILGQCRACFGCKLGAALEVRPPCRYNRQDFSHCEANEKSPLDEAIHRGMGGAGRSERSRRACSERLMGMDQRFSGEMAPGARSVCKAAPSLAGKHGSRCRKRRFRLLRTL
jgi:hypothetical protein